jgi:site-specific recombinase XerD
VSEDGSNKTSINIGSEVVPASVTAELSGLALKTRQYLAAAKADNTRRAYRADWENFESWCREHSLDSLPATAETVALYISDLASSHKPATLRRRLTVISRAHQAAGHPSPSSMEQKLVTETLKGIRRTFGTLQVGKAPLYTQQVQLMTRALPETLQGIRDRALLLLGFAGAFRRSELARLNVEDIAVGRDGLVIRLRRSKTDQEGQGRKVGIPYGSHPDTCPVRCYQDWLAASKLERGPVFRRIDRHGRLAAKALHRDSVGLIIKRAAARIGLDDAEYAGHSLRAGMCTQSFINGASELDIMRQTGHRSLATVRKYIRDGMLFHENAASKLGL